MARGVPLTFPKGVRLRPTSGQVREALFNVLEGQTVDARVLDLYAGTGGLGIEALSRGAVEVVFMDVSPRAADAILKNLSRVGMASRGRVMRGRLPASLKHIDGEFSLIFLDPPYEAAGAEETLASLAPLLADEGTVVYEHASRYNPPMRPNGLRLTMQRKYGDSGLAFYESEEGQ